MVQIFFPLIAAKCIIASSNASNLTLATKKCEDPLRQSHGFSSD